MSLLLRSSAANAAEPEHLSCRALPVRSQQPSLQSRESMDKEQRQAGSGIGGRWEIFPADEATSTTSHPRSERGSAAPPTAAPESDPEHCEARSSTDQSRR